MIWWPITRYSVIYFNTIIVKIKNKNNENRTALLKDAIKKAIHADLALLMSIHFTDQHSEYVQNKLKCAFYTKFKNT